MQNYEGFYLILPNDEGGREDTRIAIEHTEEEIQEKLDNGYVLVNSEDFNLLIGNGDKEYCINKEGTLYEKPPYVMPLEEVKANKLAELKNTRDSLEVEPIEYNGNRFDYDEKARDRINAAIIALDMQGTEASLSWTTADNTEATVTANDLRAVIANVALRSNELHVKYRDLKTKVNACETAEEVAEITWETA